MWYSGSSLLVELLSRHEGLRVIPGHLDDFRMPGGILDMYQGRHSDPLYLATFSKAERSLPRKFVRLAVRGSSKSGRQSLRREQLLANFQERFSLIDGPEERKDAVQEWWSSLKAIYGVRTDAALIDGPIYWTQFTPQNLSLLKLHKVFIVIREPEDHLAAVARRQLYYHLLTPQPDEHQRNRGCALNYVASRLQTYYQSLLAGINSFSSDAIFIIKFEDLVHNPEKYIEFLDSILGTDGLKAQMHSLSNMVRKSTGNIGIGRDWNLQVEIPNFSRIHELHTQVMGCSAYVSP